MLDINILVNKISNMVTKANVYFGVRDEVPSQLPAINIIPDDTININRLSPVQASIDYRFELVIIVNRKNEQQAYTLFDEIMNSINTVDSALGNGTQREENTAPIEYDENHFRIKIPYLYKDINTKG